MSVFHPKNAVYVKIGLLAALFAAMYAAAGLAVAAAAMVFSKLLAEGFNYLQHYGMVRVPGSPVQLHHAWNHLGSIIRPLDVEITTHIEHFDSRYKYHELKPRPEGAQMPSAFLCFVCALVPPLWEARIARPRLRHEIQQPEPPPESGRFTMITTTWPTFHRRVWPSFQPSSISGDDLCLTTRCQPWASGVGGSTVRIAPMSTFRLH